MNGTAEKGLLRRIACLLTTGATAVVIGGCGVGVEADYPAGYYYDDYPPDAYIATTAPVYYGGRASYWYGGRWYYRDGGRWGHYDREPRELYERRGQPMERRTYERSGGRGGGGRGGGGRGGRR
jgi:hypothetical protein